MQYLISKVNINRIINSDNVKYIPIPIKLTYNHERIDLYVNYVVYTMFILNIDVIIKKLNTILTNFYFHIDIF